MLFWHFLEALNFDFWKFRSENGQIFPNFNKSGHFWDLRFVKSWNFSIFFRVNQELTSRAQQFGLILDDISITHLTFGRDFTQAVELKQVAQQEAEKARFLVEKAEQIKKANIINAEGDSQAAELLATAIGKAGEGLVELRRIETAEEIATSMANSRNVVYLPQGQQTLLSLPQ